MPLAFEGTSAHVHISTQRAMSTQINNNNKPLRKKDMALKQIKIKQIMSIQGVLIRKKNVTL